MSMMDQYHTQPVQNSDVKTDTSQSNSSWNTIVILSSIGGGAVAIAGGIFTLKNARKITN